MFVGLFLLGLGFNIGLISGSTLLTTSVPVESKVEVQGTSDLMMSLSGALAAFSSGFVKQSFGFHLLANAGAALAAGLLVCAWLTAARSQAPSTLV
jgi:predicted MFS family arabinose efflux permease